MTYRVEFAAGAQTQFHNLPDDGREALIERAVDLAERPWDDVAVRPPGDDPQFRETTFGGRGILGFHVDDDRQLIRIFDLVWLD